MISQPVDVIILRGAPGVGKSEAATRLAKHFPAGSTIEVDALRKMVNSVRWTDQREHRQLLQLAARVTSDLIGFGFVPAIVVDTFSGDKVGAYLNTLKLLRPEAAVRLFALYASERVLCGRLVDRPTGRFKDFEVSRRLNADLLQVRHPDEHQIDTSALTREQVVESVVRLLRANR